MKLVLKDGIQLWFSSDSHFGHSNICEGTTNWVGENTSRSFLTLDEMNDTIVNNINDHIAEDDILVHLGDWSFGGYDNIQQFRDRIVCKNVHLVLGNHDHHIERNKGGIQSIFSSVQNYLYLDVRVYPTKNTAIKHRFICFHYPIASWQAMEDRSIHLHGHTHLPKHLKVGQGKSLDVGMDGNDLMPYSLDDVIDLVKDQPIKKLILPHDHHEREYI